MAEETQKPPATPTPPDWSSMNVRWHRAFPDPDWKTLLRPEQLRELLIVQLDWEIKELEAQLEARKSVRNILAG